MSTLTSTIFCRRMLKKRHYTAAYLDYIHELLRPLKEASYGYIPDGTELEVLDIGCGTGKDCREMHAMLAEREDVDFRITGLDHEPEFLEEAQARTSPEVFPHLRFLAGSAEALPYADDSVDYIRMERVVQHLLHPEKVFAEAVRVLRPGTGRLVIIDTDWASCSFSTEDLETEWFLKEQKVVHDLTNGRASRTLSLRVQPPLQARRSIFQAEIREVEWAGFLFGLDRNLQLMAERGRKGGPEFLRRMYALEERGLFQFSWNTVMLEIWKPFS